MLLKNESLRLLLLRRFRFASAQAYGKVRFNLSSIYAQTTLFCTLQGLCVAGLGVTHAPKDFCSQLVCKSFSSTTEPRATTYESVADLAVTTASSLRSFSSSGCGMAWST